MIKVYYKYRTQNNDGHYAEDNPEADYPNEVYFPPTWSTFLSMKEFALKDIKIAFEQEDGDEDFTNTIWLITDEDNKIIFDRENYKTTEDYDYAVKRLIERGRYA